MKIYLRANERIFINGAVLRVDRKVSIELLNDTTFLLENHVIQKEDADTPLKQLYFVVQLMLMDPASADQAKTVFRDMVRDMLATITSEELLNGVKTADVEVSSGNPFTALKTIRSLFAVEAEVLAAGSPDAEEQCDDAKVDEALNAGPAFAGAMEKAPMVAGMKG